MYVFYRRTSYDKKYYMTKIKNEEEQLDTVFSFYFKRIDEMPMHLQGIINRNFYISITRKIEEAYEIYKKMRSSIRSYVNHVPDNVTLALFGGLTELGLALWSVNQKYGLYKQEIEKLNDIIYARLSCEISYLRGKQEINGFEIFDVISGLSGIVNYCFLYQSFFHELIAEVMKLFAAQDFTKHHDYGMAHGMSGALSIMEKSLRAGMQISGMQEKIEELIQCFFQILSGEESGKERLSWTVERDSWSYGMTTMLWTIMCAAESVNDEKSYELTKELILKHLKKCKSRDGFKLISPTVVNGYGGLLAVLKQYWKKTDDSVVEKYADGIQKHLLLKFNPDSKFGYQHFEYRCSYQNVWSVEKYDLEGFAYGALGVLMTLSDSESMNIHLLI